MACFLINVVMINVFFGRRDIIQSNQRDFRAEIAKKLIGVTVLTRYNNKTYRVDDIMWDKNPTSTFECSTGEPVSFLDYYRSVNCLI